MKEIEYCSIIFDNSMGEFVARFTHQSGTSKVLGQSADLLQLLNELGFRGWELAISVSHERIVTQYILKRVTI